MGKGCAAKITRVSLQQYCEEGVRTIFFFVLLLSYNYSATKNFTVSEGGPVFAMRDVIADSFVLHVSVLVRVGLVPSSPSVTFWRGWKLKASWTCFRQSRVCACRDHTWFRLWWVENEIISNFNSHLCRLELFLHIYECPQWHFSFCFSLQEQYDFCYRVVQDFVDIFSDYANFK